MAYTILNNNGTVLLRLADGTVNSTLTSVAFVGRDVAGYGQYYNQNLVTLLTNSANPNYKPPSKPIVGQLWYDTTYNRLRIFNGTQFVSAASAVINPTAPAGLTPGDLWFDSTNNLLNYFDGYQYDSISTYARASGLTGWIFLDPAKGQYILDNTNIQQKVTLLENYGQVLGAISNSNFVASANDSTNILRLGAANTNSLTVVQGLNIIGNIAATGTIYGNLVAGSIQANNIGTTYFTATNAAVVHLAVASTATMADINSTGTIQTSGLMQSNAMSTTNLLVLASAIFNGQLDGTHSSATFNVVTATTLIVKSTSTFSNVTATNLIVQGQTLLNGGVVTTALTATNGLYSTGQFTGGYSDGIIVDYANGNGRISVGSNDQITMYAAGEAGTPMMTVSTQTTTVTNSLNVVGALSVGGAITVAATVGTPATFKSLSTTTNLAQPVTWLHITIGGANYYLPLFQ